MKARSPEATPEVRRFMKHQGILHGERLEVTMFWGNIPRWILMRFLTRTEGIVSVVKNPELTPARRLDKMLPEATDGPMRMDRRISRGRNSL